MEPQRFENIPGLLIYPHYFSPEWCGALLRDSLALHERLETFASAAGRVEKTHIPQLAFVRSSKHNLASEEFYTRVILPEANERNLSCEFFPKYGEDGHALAYFRGNANLPDFVRDSLLEPIRRSLEATRLVRPDQALTWKLTMNFYKNVGGTIAGFPFHVDIPANGVVTMIVNVQREALFQIAKGDLLTDVTLAVGALLVLSGESRYEWKHRVVPMAAPESLPGGGVQRVSLVLGYQ
jgi:hypothetical protein